MTVLYVDVSLHDRNRRGGPLDFAAVARAGLPGVMCMRATYGDPAGFHPSSPYFEETVRNARAAGYTACGGYHNLVHGDAASTARQVDYLRAALDRAGASWAMADVEPYQELVTNGLWPRWDDVRRFHDRWYSVESRRMAWYVPKWFWNPARAGQSLGGPDLRVLSGPLVQSAYGGGDGTAQQAYAAAGGDRASGWTGYGGRVPEVLQYTSTGNVAGLTGNTDCNAYRGTLEQLKAALTPDGTETDMALTSQETSDAVWRFWKVIDGVCMQDAVAAIKHGVDQLLARPLAALTGEQLDKLAAAVADAVVAADNPLGPQDLAAVVAAVRPLLAEAAAEVRDAVADLAEGGAAQVRADAD